MVYRKENGVIVPYANNSGQNVAADINIIDKNGKVVSAGGTTNIQALVSKISDDTVELSSDLASLYTVTYTAQTVASNSDYMFEISPPTGYTTGVLMGILNTTSYSYCELVGCYTVSIVSSNYPSRIKVKNTYSSAAEIRVYMMWFK